MLACRTGQDVIDGLEDVDGILQRPRTIYRAIGAIAG